MKCQKCGKSEVNFHYTSNVNGCVTETHLCSECAAGAGYDLERMFGGESVFNRFFPVFGMQGMFAQPQPIWRAVLPRYALPNAGAAEATQSGCSRGNACAREGPEAITGEVDDEMKKRREVNALREQMRIAAGKDDFEKAIELRERIKEYEI